MADETTKFESAQALFCAFVDLVGSAKSIILFFGKGKGKSQWNERTLVYDTYEDFISDGNNKKNIAKAFKSVVTPGMNLTAMETFLKKKPAWFHSSCIIAIKLITGLHTSIPGKGAPTDLKKFKRLKDPGIDMDYVRGDPKVMKMIENLFKIANKNESLREKKLPGMKGVTFGDVNKWNPGDIYYATDTAVKELAKEYKIAQTGKAYDFDALNKITSGLLMKGQLLPLSLKKQTNPANVKIEMVNWGDTYKKQKLKEVQFQGIRYEKYKIPARGKKGAAKELPSSVPTTRDLVIQVKDGNNKNVGNIQMRHDPSGTGSWKVDFKYTGAEARGGSVVSYNLFADLWSLVDSTVAEDFRKTYFEGSTEFCAQVYSNGKRGKDAKGPPRDRKGGIPVNKPIKNKELNNNFKYYGEGGLAHHISGKAKAKDWSNQKRLWQIPFKGPSYDDKKGRYTSSAYDFQKGEISALTIVNKVGPIIAKWFKGATPRQKNSFVRILYQYVSSRHPLAGKFVIAK